MSEDVRVLLVGEQNPFGGDPSMALFPLPRGSSGNRIREILGLSDVEYMKTFSRANLLNRPGKWSAPEARERARTLTAICVGQRICKAVLLGAKVSAAFGLPTTPFEEYLVGVDTVRALVLPHPSGLSRAWNEPSSRQRARDCWKILLGDRP